MYFQNNQKTRKIIQLSSVMKSETRKQGNDDWEAGAALDGDLGEPPVLSSQPSSFMVASQLLKCEDGSLVPLRATRSESVSPSRAAPASQVS